MTYQGFIVFYNEHEIPLKKVRYNNLKRRKKLIEIGKKIFKDELAFYEIIPYVYVYPKSIDLSRVL